MSIYNRHIDGHYHNIDLQSQMIFCALMLVLSLANAGDTPVLADTFSIALDEKYI